MQNETILINGIEYPVTHRFTEAEKLQNSPEIEGLERVIRRYYNGKIQGCNGKIDAIYYLKDGNKEGSWKCYYETGVLYGEGNHKDGNKEGLWKFYYETGALDCEHNYKDDKAEGLWKYYYETGMLEREENWKDGKLVTKN